MKNFNFKTGFTIVEMLVAISILLIGVLGPLGVASRGISDGIYAKNQIAATYLAQEAMEVFINTRNTNLLLNQKWLTGIDNENSEDTNGADCIVTPGPAYCYVDAFATDDHEDGANPGLISEESSYDDDDFRLQYCTATSRYERLTSSVCDPADRRGPIFTRWAEVEETQNDLEIRVTVKIQWQNKTVTKDLELVQYLYALANDV